MTNQMKLGIVGALAGVAIIGIAVWGYYDKGTVKDIGENGDSSKTTTQETPMKEIKKDPIKVSAVERVFSRKTKGEFGLAGRGEDAKWGVAKTANFKYTVMIIADSNIKSKEVLPGGEIKVVEIRTFDKIQDAIVVSDVDMKLDLKSVPVETFSKAIDWAVTAWVSLTGDAASGAMVHTGKEYVKQQLKTVDGTSVRALLGATGFQPTQEVENAITKLAHGEILKALGGVKSISGKSYKITYYQKQSGEPMYVNFSYADGKEVTDDEEKMVLRRVNSFIDYTMVPNKNCMPGDNWTIQAEDMQEVFDPYVNGDYTGIIQVTRKSNQDNGDWTINLSPSMINIINDTGNTTGYLNLKEGYAHINPQNVNINELFVEGKAKLQSVSKHHWLFTSRIAGECNFQGKVITTYDKE